MKLIQAELNNVRAVEHATINFAERGVTLIEGPNESGKSTILSAILAVFEHEHTSRKGQSRRGAKSKSAAYMTNPATLRALGRPGGPEVTLTFEIDGNRYTIFKRWIEKPQARLEQETPTRRIWEGKDAERQFESIIGNSEPITALLLAQGTGMDVFDPAGLTTLDQELSTTLAAQDGNDTSTFTPASAEPTGLLGAIRDEYTTYFTEKKGEPTGDYKRAIDAVAVAQEAHRAARDAAIRFRDDRERYQELLAESARISETLLPEAERRQAELTTKNAEIAQLEAVVDSARNTLEKAEADVRLARTRSDHRTILREELSQAQQHSEVVTAAFAQAEAQDKEFAARRQAAQSAVDFASAEFDLASWVADLYTTAHEWEQASTRVASLDDKLARVADAQVRLEQADAQLADPTAVLDDASYEQLTAAFDDVEVCRRVLEATAGTITIDGPDGYHEHFTLDANRELTLGNYTVTITAGDGASDRAATLQAAERTLERLTASYSVATREEAQARHTAFSQATDQRARAADELALVLDGESRDDVVAERTAVGQRRDELGYHYSSLRSSTPGGLSGVLASDGRSGDTDSGDLSGATASGDLSGATAPDDLFGTTAPDGQPAPATDSDSSAPATESDSRRSLLELLPAEKVDDVDLALRDRATTLYENIRAALTAAERELQAVKESYDVAEITVARNNVANAQAAVDAKAQALAAERAKTSDEDLAEALAVAQRALTEQHAATREAQATLDELQPEFVKSELAAATTMVNNLKERLFSMTRESDALRGGLEALALRPAAAEEAAAELERAEQTLASVQRRAEAAKLLWETVNRHYTTARRTWAAPYLERLTEMARRVFGEDVSFDPHDDEPLSIRARMNGSISVPVEMLSGGAKEQMGILQRLAVADLLPDGVPVLLDDALGYADPYRIRRMNRVLADSARRHQIIVCTCVPERYLELESTRVEWTWR